VDRNLLRSAVAGKSAEQSHRNRVFSKRCFLPLADLHSFCLYHKEQITEAVWALHITVFCPAISLLHTTYDSGFRKPLERYRRKLHAAGNDLPYCVYALRWISGGTDFQRFSVYGYRKE